MIFDEVEEEIERGRQGLNVGLSTGLPKFDNLIGGLQRKTYYLLGANLGVGKTAFADSAFILNPYKSTLKEGCKSKLRVFYYSFEISKVEKILKWVAYLVYEKYGIIIDLPDMYSQRSRMSDEKYNIIKEQRDFVERMMDCIHIIDKPLNPTGLYMDVSDYMNRNGTIKEEVKVIKGKEIRFKKYTPNDPNEIVLYVEDHIGLVRGEKELRNKKEKIDKGSEYAISLRNFFGVSKLAISQFNRDLADIERRRFTELTPQLEDFKDSGNTAEDANIVMTLFNPLRYNLQEYGGFTNLMALGGRYRSLSILKNRAGRDMVKHNLNFMGEVGHFREFPDPFMQNHTRQAKEYTKFT